MEIKARLMKPYTFEEKRDFILLQNRRNGYEIRESEESLDAMGYTYEELIIQDNKARVEKIKSRLTEIDVDSTRPLRAIIAGEASETDRLKLAELEEEAEALREELRGLINE